MRKGKEKKWKEIYREVMLIVLEKRRVVEKKKFLYGENRENWVGVVRELIMYGDLDLNKERLRRI